MKVEGLVHLRAIHSNDVTTEPPAGLQGKVANEKPLQLCPCISERQTVGCYSWIYALTEHTLAVPGLPPVLSLPISQSRGSTLRGKVLHREDRIEFYHENAFHDPSHPVEQLFCAASGCQERWSAAGRVNRPCACSRSVSDRSKGDVTEEGSTTKAMLCFASFDFITDRSVLRALLRFLYRDIAQYSRSASIDVDVYGETCVFTHIHEETRGPDVGFGHRFERECAEKPRITVGESTGQASNAVDVRDLSSFHLIQSFVLCGTLRLLVRTEVDACIHPEALQDRTDHPTNKTKFFGNSGCREDGPEYVNDYRQGPTLYLSRRQPSTLTPFEDCLLDGNERCLQELKSASERNESRVPWQDLYFQMRIGGVSRLLMAVHSRGRILRTEYCDLPAVARKAFCQTLGFPPGSRGASGGGHPHSSHDNRASTEEPSCASEVEYWCRLATILLEIRDIALSRRGPDKTAFLRIEIGELSELSVYERQNPQPRLSKNLYDRLLRCFSSR
ncbi:transcription factor btf3 [Cystoisospora suis]|uniref:Transcription factor btf3 n=1 Tax=Cystoisospora suis TaxID=483139 RepID=A0A2C6L2Y5_9APIC|nr:transcription factor btf3 [Cystoisospora suis]